MCNFFSVSLLSVYLVLMTNKLVHKTASTADWQTCCQCGAIYLQGLLHRLDFQLTMGQRIMQNIMTTGMINDITTQ